MHHELETLADPGVPLKPWRLFVMRILFRPRFSLAL
jgi:hypothetical protein